MSLDEDFLRQFKLKGLRPGERDAVESAANRQEKRTGGRINRSDTAAVIQSYISRFREILDREDPAKREQGLDNLKHILYEQFLINPANIPDSYYASIKRRHRDEGHGDIEIPDDQKAEIAGTAVEDQRRSLDAWIDYLASDDAKYPDALKYWTFRSILKMGRFDKERGKFANREGKGPVAPFPELNREALAVIMDDMEKKYKGNTDYTFASRYDIDETAKKSYGDAMEKENFSALYALSIDAFKPIPEELLQETAGEWRTYKKGSIAKLLVDSIADYGTGWCLRGEPTARRYLESNDLHVYYSNDEDGRPTVPRVVMVINQVNQITEVRGIEAHEHLDSHILPVVEAALSSHPDGKKFQKKSADMERLTAIERKTKQNQPLIKDDLLFLYEVNSRIEGFGYENAGRDPRIEEIRGKRNPKEDLPIIFECTSDQIAWSSSDIKNDTRVYIGKIEQGLFDLLGRHGIEHVYTSFPEGRIRLESLEIGGMTADALERALEDAGIKTNTYSKSMLRNKKQFMDPVNKRHKERRGKTETLDLVHLRLRDLGFTSMPTTRELLGEFDAEGNLTKKGRIHELGFELCPPETGPYQRLADTDQPLGNWYYIGMQPVADSDGRPSVFGCQQGEGGARLFNLWADPDYRWYLGFEFILRRRKSAA